jgi:hypothetical protein
MREERGKEREIEKEEGAEGSSVPVAQYFSIDRSDCNKDMVTNSSCMLIHSALCMRHIVQKHVHVRFHESSGWCRHETEIKHSKPIT